MTIMPYLTRPKSLGSVVLRSRDPFDPPIVDPNYLSHPDDVHTLVNGEWRQACRGRGEGDA